MMPTRTPIRTPIVTLARHAAGSLARLAAASALSLAVAAPALANTEADARDVRPAGSFAGAVLAASTAERDADFETAVRFLREALAFEETDGEGDGTGDADVGAEGLRLGLLRALVLSGRFDEAVGVARTLEEETGVETDPQNLILLTLVADALNAREWNRALALLDVEGVNDLDRFLFASLTAWAHAGGGDREAALAAFDDLDGAPDWVEFYVDYARAMVLDHLGDADAAATAYRAALDRTDLAGQLRETTTRIGAALAGLEARRGDAGAALAALDATRDVIGDDPLLAATREAVEAGREPRRHVAGVADGASEVLYGLGMALTGSRAGDLARNYLQLARALNPQAAAPLIGLASVEELAGRPEAAIALYDQIGETDPLIPIARLQRGLNLADLDRLEEAETALRTLYERSPDDLRTIVALGNTLAIAEKWDAAATLYDEVLGRIEARGEALERVHWQLLYRRGIAHERMKEWPAAEADFLAALELRPDHPPVLNYLGYSWIDQGMELERGLEMIRTAVRLQPNSGAYVDSLGWAYYRLGRFEDAVRELERALGLETSDPVIHDHLGDAYWRVGREREARYQWGHALRMDLEVEDRRRIRAKLTSGLAPLAEVETERADDDA